MARSAAVALLLLAQPALPLRTGAHLMRFTPPLSLAPHSRPVLPSLPHCTICTIRMEADEKGEGQAEPESAAVAEDVVDETNATGNEASAPVDADAKENVEKSEKDILKESIAAVEAELKLARGKLIDEQERVKDAGEAGYMLLAADFERYRLQARSELNLQEVVGKKAAIVPLLPFVEEFQRLQSAGDSTGEENPIHKYYSGIYKQLNQLLESWDVSSFEATVGEKYDPLLHSKAKITESDEPAGTILEVSSKGWTLGAETLRPAACTVSIGPPKPAPDLPEDEQTTGAADSEAGEGEVPDENTAQN